MNPDLLFRSACIIDPESPFNGQTRDILVKKGHIAAIGTGLPAEDIPVIDCRGLSLSPGLFDMQVSCGEPGYEEKETFQTLSDAALSGGITDVLVMPSLQPVTDQRSQVEYIRRIKAKIPLSVHVAGALSAGLKGQELAGLYDMFLGGAIAFTDDKSPVNNSMLLHLALQYSGVSGGLLMLHSEDPWMSLGGKINEGEMSVTLGMKGAPALSEELGVMRNIALAQYNNTGIHLSGISTKGAVALVRKAKSENIPVSCSVYAHQLYFDETALGGFSSLYKVWPPLRTHEDRLALAEGLKDGTIDVICSDHRPENKENKEVEFDQAAHGITGLETLYGAAAYALGDTVSPELLVAKMSHAPRQLLGLEPVRILENTPARFFLYNPQEEYTFSRELIRSKSSNTPFPGKPLKGKIKGTFVSGHWFENGA